MRLFWISWSFAFGLVAGAIAVTAWVIALSAPWSLPAMVTARALCIGLGLVAFVGAFRLAVLGTVSLRDTLARNLAIVIRMELDDLRRAMSERAAALGDGATEEARVNEPSAAGAQRFPALLGSRDDVRKLLGKATEHTLEQVLASLNSYNEAVEEVDVAGVSGPESRRNARLELRNRISVVQASIAEAMRSVAPFCEERLTQLR